MMLSVPKGCGLHQRMYRAFGVDVWSGRAHLAWTFDPGVRKFFHEKNRFHENIGLSRKRFFFTKNHGKWILTNRCFFTRKMFWHKKKFPRKKSWNQLLQNIWKMCERIREKIGENWWKFWKIVQDFAKNWQKRCPRNPVFGARDPGRKTKFPKGFPRKKTPIFKILPCGAKKWACGASVKGIVFYTKGARADSPKNAVFGWFCARARKKNFFLKFKK